MLGNFPDAPETPRRPPPANRQRAFPPLSRGQLAGVEGLDDGYDENDRAKPA